MIPDAIAVALEVAEVLDNLGVSYLIGGSAASSVWGEPRATKDVDVVAELGLEHTDRIVGALQREYCIAPEAVQEAVARGSCFNIIHLKRMQKVDVFVARLDSLGREELRRRLRTTLATDPDRSAFLATPEDTVLRKLEWYRKGGEVYRRTTYPHMAERQAVSRDRIKGEGPSHMRRTVHDRHCRTFGARRQRRRFGLHRESNAAAAGVLQRPETRAPFRVRNRRGRGAWPVAHQVEPRTAPKRRSPRPSAPPAVKQNPSTATRAAFQPRISNHPPHRRGLPR